MSVKMLEQGVTNSTGFTLERIWGAQLSQRELEVGSLAIAGCSTQEIAESLFISENTVKTHLRNLFRKTKTRSRNELYRRLVEADLTARPGTQVDPDSFEGLFHELRAGRDGGANTTAVLIELRFLRDGEPTSPPHSAVADLLVTSIRKRDHIYHWRDDLFLLVLPGSDRLSSKEVAVRLLRKVDRWAELKGLTPLARIGAAGLDDAATPHAVVDVAAQRMKPLDHDAEE